MGERRTYTCSGGGPTQGHQNQLKNARKSGLEHVVEKNGKKKTGQHERSQVWVLIS